MRVALAVGLAIVIVGAAARAGLVRGTLKIDVRDPAGAPRQAKVTVRAEATGETTPVQRAGEVYVAEGLLDGVWRVEVAGAPPQRVRVIERQPVGAVVVLDETATRERGRADRRRDRGHAHASDSGGFTVTPEEPACAFAGGVLVDAIAFVHDGLGAGRLEVRRGAKLLCAATIAGGGATLRLAPGEYRLTARFVGGGSAQESYRVSERAAPLILRAR